MKIAKVKQMIKLIEQEGANQLMLLLLEYSQPDIHKNIHISTIEEFTDNLRSMIPDNKDPKQRDIEDLIDEIKDEIQRGES